MAQHQGESPGSIDPIVKSYGNLVFDLCESLLWHPSNSQIAYRNIIKILKKQARIQAKTRDPFEKHEREWVLRVACTNLLDLSKRARRKLTASEQIELDSNPAVSNRLKNFQKYFYRLSIEDQLLLVLRDKHGLPYPEIATALSVPEGSLKVRRQIALRALEGWVWE